MKLYSVTLGSLLIMACNESDKVTHTGNEASTIVKTTTLSVESIDSQIAASGSVEGLTTVKLGFMVAGKINFISSKEGQIVSQGQLISSLDPTDFSLAKQLTDVKLNAANDEFKRLKLMHSKGSLSESDFSKTNFSLQEAQLQQKIQSKNLSDTRLYAPINGVLLDKQAEVGEVIAAGSPLFVIADIRKVIVSVFIPESELRNTRIGQLAEVSIAAVGKTFTGKVSEVGAVADGASRAFKLKIEVENPGLLIRPGMIAEARLHSGNSRTGVLLPVECIMHDVDSQNYVFVADKAAQKAFKRKISLGNIIENKAEVLSGLAAGEAVVTAGQEKLVDGSPITVVK